MRRRATLALALAGAALAAAPADAGPRKTIRIGDNYFQPAKVTVRPKTTIVWRWPSEGGDVHDVRLRKGPKGVKRFQSEPASGPYTYRRTLTRPGTYTIVCTLHEEMRMTIRVRKR